MKLTTNPRNVPQPMGHQRSKTTEAYFGSFLSPGRDQLRMLDAIWNRSGHDQGKGA